MARRPLIAGNWKMNGLLSSVRALARAVASPMREGVQRPADVLVCPVSVHIPAVAEVLEGSGVKLGGQDCHAAQSGAHTGDVAAVMLADLGCSHVIVGHSERRTDHRETSAQVRAKAEAALAAGLVPIVCVGETEAQRDAGQADAVVTGQVRDSLPAAGEVVIAYEPVWAIGTGKTATPDDVAAMHATIRTELGNVRGEAFGAATLILYGGSVKPDNAPGLLALEDVDGALVGGASLKADDFWAIIEACPR